MLISALAAMFLIFSGQVSTEDYFNSIIYRIRTEVPDLVHDQRRLSEIDSMLTDMQSKAGAFHDVMADLRRRLWSVERNYDASREQVEAVLREMDEVWVRFEGKMLDFRFALRDKLTENQWRVLFRNISARTGYGK